MQVAVVAGLMDARWAGMQVAVAALVVVAVRWMQVAVAAHLMDALWMHVAVAAGLMDA